MHSFLKPFFSVDETVNNFKNSHFEIAQCLRKTRRKTVLMRRLALLFFPPKIGGFSSSEANEKVGIKPSLKATN